MSSPATGPLSGVRIIDLTSTIAGPSATRCLADFGAEVIKVESATHPDTARLSSPFANGERGLNSSGYFSAYNAGKLSLALNLRSQAGVEALGRLVRVSDVLVESFAPGVMARLGLSDETLRTWNDRLVIAHHSLQGQNGPRSRQRGYGQLASAMTGWFEVTGNADEEPVGPYSAYTDFIAWPILAASIVLALEERDRHGTPSVIDHSHIESSAYFAAPELLAAQRGEPPARHGNDESYCCPSDAFPCDGEDEWCAITVENDGSWAALCAVLGAYDLAGDPRFSNLDGRRANNREIRERISSHTRTRDSAELEQALLAAGVGAARVYQAQDLFADSQLSHRRALRVVEHPVLGRHSVVAPAFSVSGVESGPHIGFPLLGEHTELICKDVIGLLDDEIAGFAERGAFE